MPLIKRADQHEIARDAVVLDLGDLARQGELLRRRAEDRAAAIVAEATAAASKLRAAAVEEGRRAGHAEGLAAGRDAGVALGRDAALAEFRPRLADLAAAWTAALDRFEADRARLLAEADRDVARLAMAIAERVIKRAIDVRPESVVDQTSAVLAEIARPTRVQIRVHPDDAALVREALPALTARLAAAAHAEVAEDPSLSRGSCVARTAGGEIDASIATQLDRLARVLVPDEPGREPALRLGPGQSRGAGHSAA